MTDILYVSGQVPSDEVPIAGQKVAFSNLKELATSYRIHCVAFLNDNERPFFQEDRLAFCETLTVIHVSKIERLVNVAKRIWLPAKVGGRFSNKVLKKLEELIKTHNISEGYFEFTSVMHFAAMLRPSLRKITFVEHDLTYQSLERRASQASRFTQLFFQHESRRMKHYELRHLAMFEDIIVLNEKDGVLLKDQGINNVRVSYPRVKLKKIQRQVQTGCLGFIGAMHRPENEAAAIHFISNILPLVLTQHEVEFWIIGANPSKKIQSIADSHPNVFVTGFVDRLEDYYSKVELVVVPLLSGAGVKIKTIEALSFGIPTISTPIGAEGVVNSDGLLRVAETSEEFAKAINAALDDPQL